MRYWNVVYRTACPAEALNRIEGCGIAIYHVEQADPYELHFQIHRSNIVSITSIAHKHSDLIQIKPPSKAHSSWFLVRSHPILIIGIVIILSLTLFLPSRILFIQIAGNTTVSSAKIQQVLAQNGINFGASKADIQSNLVKTTLLSEIPQLQWAGIRIRGCVATVTVQERKTTVPSTTPDCIFSIVAGIDGVIHDITVSQGHGLCKPGDVVRAGQTLISPYEDLGICIRATQPEGEIYAYTMRHFSAIMLAKRVEKRKVEHTETNFFLILGKKRINFCNNSGILGSTCDKIYEQRYITLPGGYALPLIIGKVTYVYYNTEDHAQSNVNAALNAFAVSSLQQQMIAGAILNTNENYVQNEDIFRLDGVYACYEMIGRLRAEECLP